MSLQIDRGLDKVAMDITFILEKNNVDLDSAKHVLYAILFSVYEYEILEGRKNIRQVSDTIEGYKAHLLRILREQKCLM